MLLVKRHWFAQHAQHQHYNTRWDAGQYPEVKEKEASGAIVCQSPLARVLNFTDNSNGPERCRFVAIINVTVSVSAVPLLSQLLQMGPPSCPLVRLGMSQGWGWPGCPQLQVCLL